MAATSDSVIRAPCTSFSYYYYYYYYYYYLMSSFVISLMDFLSSFFL